jgi:hypothetical protein
MAERDAAEQALDWVGRMHALTVVGEDDCGDPVARSRLLVADLAVAATAAVRRAAPAAFGAVPGGDGPRELAAELAAALPLSRLQQRHAARILQRDLVPAYLDALMAAAPAVAWCRRLAHSAHGCWFDPAGPDAGLCGRVLAQAHLAATSARGRARQRWDQTGEPR